MLLSILQSKLHPCQTPFRKIFWSSVSLSCFSERSPRGEKQFWEFHVTSTGTLLGVCSHSDLQNIWMKGMCFNPPLFVFG